MIFVKITFHKFTTCRVNYDEANWLALASVLATARGNIHPLNREQIICDVAALANTGHVSADIRDQVQTHTADTHVTRVWQVLAYIDTETEWGPLYAYQQCAVTVFIGEDTETGVWRI